MEGKIAAYVRKHHMLEQGDKVIIGVSGGADSVCLFFALLELCEAYNLSLHVVHVNHQIRGEAAETDQRFVEALASAYGVPVTIVKRDVPCHAKEAGLTEEEAGREVRYLAFRQAFAAEQATKIAVAHNMNDNAETMLFHLARGSGMRGLGGIAPVRGEIIRPLLCLTREEIEAYLKVRNQTYRTDASNFSDDYSRNRIRHHLLPRMTELNARAVEHMSEASGFLREAQGYIERQAQAAYKRIVREQNGQYLLKIGLLLAEDTVIQKEVILKGIFALTASRKDIDSRHIEAILRLCELPTGRQANLPYGMKASREYDELRIEILSKEDKAFEIRIEGEGIYPIPGMDSFLEISIEPYLHKVHEIPKNDYTKWFDYDKICQAMSLRSRRKADYFQINKEGGTKKLKDYFIDQKLPRSKRDTIPLLADGGHIIWILGNRISEKYKITDTTRNILKAKIIGGKK